MVATGMDEETVEWKQVQHARQRHSQRLERRPSGARILGSIHLQVHRRVQA